MGKQSRKKRHERKATLPPVPPGAETLRSARDVIDPDQIYQFVMPDGTLFVTQGADLLETSDATIAVLDAIETGETEVLRAAFDRWVASGPDSIVICTQVGQTQDYPIPPGYLLAECSWCGGAVWISAANHRRVAQSGGGLKPVCSACLPFPPETATP